MNSPLQFDNIIIFGDIHGDWRELIKFSKKYDIVNSLFLICGDFGIGFQKNHSKELKTLTYYNDHLRSRKNYVKAIRGNHDNPFYYEENLTVGNIELISDYTTKVFNKIKFLFVGGAISVDRKPNRNITDMFGKYHKGRTQGRDYWEEEQVIYEPETVKKIENVDVVISHSAPDFCYPQHKQNIEKWIQFDNQLIDDIKEERDILSNVYEILKEKNNIKYWFYGHFHTNWNERIDGTDFILLDVDNHYELKI